MRFLKPIQEIMLQPKRVKYRKVQKGRLGKIAQRGHTLAFGSFGIKALESCWLTARQIEAARIVINRTMKRQGVMWTRVFPDISRCKKPAEVRMGKGKGNPEYWVVAVKAGRILYEIEGIEPEEAQRAIRLAGKKLPVKTKMVVRNQFLTT